MTYFDQIAGEFDAEPRRVELASAIGDGIISSKILHSGMHVMDYGAGTGLLTLKLLPYVERIVAVDTSPKMLEVLQEKITRTRIANLETLLWNVETDAIPTQRYDGIVGSMVFHHIRDVERTIGSFYTMLKPGGIIAFADLDREDGDFHADHSGVYHFGFDRNDLSLWFQRAGFRQIRFLDPYVVKKPNSAGDLKEYPIFLCLASK